MNLSCTSEVKKKIAMSGKSRLDISYYFLLNYSFLADREVQRILLELLNQMDGFDQNVNVKVKRRFLLP